MREREGRKEREEGGIERERKKERVIQNVRNLVTYFILIFCCFGRLLRNIIDKDNIIKNPKHKLEILFLGKSENENQEANHTK